MIQTIFVVYIGRGSQSALELSEYSYLHLKMHHLLRDMQ